MEPPSIPLNSPNVLSRRPANDAGSMFALAALGRASTTSDPGPRVPEFRWAQRAGTLRTHAHICGRLPT